MAGNAKEMKPSAAFRFLALLTLLPALVFGQSASQSTEPPPLPLSQGILDRLPAAYKEDAKSLVKATDETQQRWLKLSDEDLSAAVVGQLSRKAEAADFVLKQLEKEPSAKLRARIIGSFDWTSHPQSQQVLERHASSDADAGVSLQALETLRKIRLNELAKLLEARLDAAKKSGDTAGLVKLAQEQERKYSWFGALTLPSFLRVSPPLFSVKSADSPIRVLAFGDFGFGNDAQKQTAAAMVRYHKLHPFDFGITLGDNFYTYGMDSPADPRWQTQFEQLYGPMGIKIYASFGNHDYGQPDSPAAEILYSDKSPDWRLLAPYYTYTAGPVQFFAIDTIDLSEAELLWLDQGLTKSQAQWKVVYGHYPVYSATGEDKQLAEKLLPVLKKDNVDIYICGHHHNLQELKPEGKLHFFISGGGGATLYNVDPAYPRSVFEDKVNGFSVLEADAKHFKVTFIGLDGKELHSSTVEK
jgi:tartrate-resistant acid phosphatase type 5